MAECGGVFLSGGYRMYKCKLLYSLFFVFAFALITGVHAKQYEGTETHEGALFEVSRSSKVIVHVTKPATNKVVLHGFDMTDAALDNYYWVTGTLKNDSYGGVYDVRLTFIWRDASGKALGTEDVYTVCGHPAAIKSSYADIDEDYIAPLKLAYFSSIVEIPAGASIDNSSYLTTWTWTLQADKNADVVIKDGVFNIGEDRFGYREITGTVQNKLAQTLEYVEVIAVVLLSDGTVADVANTYVASSSEYMLPNSSKDFELNVRPRFSDGNDIRVLLFVSFSFLDADIVYDSGNDDTAYAMPAIPYRVTVRDTVYVKEEGLLGDLNGDGVVNIEDLLILAENFGRTSN